MEAERVEMESPGRVSGGPGSSRWNPTKEQIQMLENLCLQGVRKPSAEQIQQITSRLRAYGHIEGKNVFYWFQNHKARQRQKQKQENLAFFNRFLLRNTPQPLVFGPPPPYPCPNVVCGPYYMQQNDRGLIYNPTVVLPGGVGWKPSSEKLEKLSSYGGITRCENEHEESESYRKMETLQLFPMHPTAGWNLQGKSIANSVGLLSSADQTFTSDGPAASISSGGNVEEASEINHTYFDFFCGHHSHCDTH